MQSLGDQVELLNHLIQTKGVGYEALKTINILVVGWNCVFIFSSK